MKKFIVFVLTISCMPIFCMEDDDSLNLVGALKPVLEKALIHDRQQRRLRECVKALDLKEAHLCILVTDCEDESYRLLMRAMVNVHLEISPPEQHCKYGDAWLLDQFPCLSFRSENKIYGLKEDNVANAAFLSFMDFFKKK